MCDFYALLKRVCRTEPRALVRLHASERHFLLDDGRQLEAVCREAAKRQCRLVSLLACDERELEDNAFKVYCVLSTPAGELITLEHRLDRDQPTWHSIGAAFGGALPLEREMADLFDLGIEPPLTSAQRQVLVGAYPKKYAPLRRDATALTGPPVPIPAPPPPEKLPEGLMILPVGPIHAGVIQPGYFAFHVAGEVVEELPVQLGFTHRGIEKLFEGYALTDGWQLAERVAGDSAFAHSLAYCRAVESLAGFKVAERVALWRGLLLELERIANHMADCAAIVHDMAFDRPSSWMTVVQERLVRLGKDLTGNRLLKGVNRPGAVVFPAGAGGVLAKLDQRLAALVNEFLGLAIEIMKMPECRDRMISTGVLTAREAVQQGATGLPARASGLWLRDFRWRHFDRSYECVEGPGTREWQAKVRAALGRTHATGRSLHAVAIGGHSTLDAPGTQDPAPGQAPGFGTLGFVPHPNLRERRAIASDGLERRILVRPKDLTGDVFARTLLRLAEIETSARIVKIAVEHLREHGEPSRLEQSVDPAQPDPDLLAALRRAHNFDFGIGCVEGWRGAVCYWIMKGPRGGIYRCKVRDPSVFNWPALAKAVERKERRLAEPGRGKHHENIRADFPLINKSFNLSYAGTDL